MTPYTEIYERFLLLVQEYDFIQLEEEEFEEIFEIKLEMALSKLLALDITMNPNTQTFNRELTTIEKTILAHALLAEWLTQRVYDVQNMRNNLASKDFKIFSAANHLSELRALHEYATKEVSYLIGQYLLNQTMTKVKF